VPGTGSGSASNALSSAAANIGLRTQSIQLMRDSLYRLCEASNNGRINESDMAMLLRRSQDLTAVVVAVEQLTGAVVAQQAAVTTNAQASASASLVANQQLLGEMEDQVAKKQAAVDEAEAALKDATAARDQAATDKAAADAQLAQTNNAANQTAATNAKDTLDSKQRVVDNRQRDLDLRKQQLADAERVRDEIKAARDSALTNSNASTGGSAQFSQAQQRKELDKSASEKIATVVGEMVEAVLSKEYTVDHCMTLLSTAKHEGSVAVQICKEIMIKSAERALGKTISTYAPDSSTDKLNEILKSGKVTTTQLRAWLKDPNNRAGTTSVTFFKTGSEFAAKRREFINSVK